MSSTIAVAKWALPKAAELYKNREVLVSVWKRITKYFATGSPVAFTGMSGAGKTVLYDYLSGKAFKAGYKPAGLSRAPDVGKMQSRSAISIITVPGQQAPQRHKALDKVFSVKKHAEAPEGVVHVVCNGFPSTRSAEARKVLVEDRKITTIAAYRALRKEEELADLDVTCELLRTSIRQHRRPLWLIIAVDKLDLYYDELPSAQERYSPEGKGPFVERLKRVVGQVGSDQLEWTAVPVCAWLEDFEWNGEKRPSQLRDAERNHYLATFAEVLENHCGK